MPHPTASAPSKPYDQRLANLMVRPLVRTPVSPNALTALSLALGLAAAWLFAAGHPAWGGTVFAIASFSDHADGELARMAGKTSRFGHYFDRTVASINYTAVFLGMGLGADTTWGWPAGLIAGVSIAGIFAVRNLGEARRDGFMDQATGAGFETEDVMYLIAPIGWMAWHPWFVAAAAIGAPIYLAITLLRLRRPNR